MGVAPGDAGAFLDPAMVAAVLNHARADFPAALLPVGWTPGGVVNGWPVKEHEALFLPASWRRGTSRWSVPTTTTSRWRRRTAASTCWARWCATRSTSTCCARCWPRAGSAPAAARRFADAAQVELLAVRPAWVRITAADGSTIFEKILDAGERYPLPKLEEAPILRVGESGALYFAVNGQTYGPAGARGSVTKNVTLSPEALTAAYAVADMAQDADLVKFSTADATSAVAVEPVAE